MRPCGLYAFQDVLLGFARMHHLNCGFALSTHAYCNHVEFNGLFWVHVRWASLILLCSVSVSTSFEALYRVLTKLLFLQSDPKHVHIQRFGERCDGREWPAMRGWQLTCTSKIRQRRDVGPTKQPLQGPSPNSRPYVDFDSDYRLKPPLWTLKERRRLPKAKCHKVRN